MKHKFSRRFGGIVMLALAICCIVLVLHFGSMNSTDAGEIISGLSDRLLWVLGLENLKGSTDGSYELIARKLMHFLCMASVGFTLYSAVIHFRLRPLNNLAIIVPLSVAVAVVEELLQLFSPGRTCKLYDMVLNSLGACFGISMAMLLYFIIKHIVQIRKR